MTIPKNVLDMDKGLTDWCILHAYRGSIAHGMFVPSTDPDSIDDKDTMAVCVPPREYYLGLDDYGSKGTKEIKHDEWDIVVYEARKFLRLLEKGNPNVLTMLWVADNYVIKNTRAGRLLRERRQLFVGSHVYHSFVGYAHGQMHRMTHMAFEGYMGQKRKELVTRYGYDTKNAAHLIRILRMGIEFLKEGELNVVLRADNNQLLEIKKGEWTLEAVKAEATRLFALASEVYARSTLPTKPDHAKVQQLCVDLVEIGWAYD